MDNRRQHREWVNRIILGCALLMFLFSEGIVIAASLGWPNHQTAYGTHELLELLVNLFITSIPFVVGIWGCMVVKRVQAKCSVEAEEASFVWLWRQYLTGIVFAYVALTSVVVSLARSFGK